MMGGVDVVRGIGMRGRVRAAARGGQMVTPIAPYCKQRKDREDER